YRIEWWYYTGNLRAADGRRLGYQLTFFRTGVQRDPQNPSRWVVEDIYTAHFAVSDLGAGRHQSAQRGRRAGIGRAGADEGGLRVWNGAWRCEADGDHHLLTAAHDGMAIDLRLTPTKGPILHGPELGGAELDGTQAGGAELGGAEQIGTKGLSQKGAQEGNASYYYSYPRMKTTGTVTFAGQAYQVTGDSWMDHEFSTSFLEEAQQGWDWFSIQFEDNSELMLYQMRRTDGTVDPYSSGTFINAAGEARHLAAADFTMTPRGTWRSAATGADYPLRWRIDVPVLGMQLAARPAFESQEMTTEATTGIAYWEGAVLVDGAREGAPLAGRGYLELTGYTEVGLGSLLAE
ncbi:MAG: lipocalin-like domain-containing protein, partial [Planctomycetota bacterium]